MTDLELAEKALVKARAERDEAKRALADAWQIIMAKEDEISSLASELARIAPGPRDEHF